MPPFAILHSGETGIINIVANGSIYDISRENCYLTNCINSTTHPIAFLIVHQPPYVLLLINLSSLWYEDPAIFALEHVVDSLSCPEGFTVALMPGATALIAIIGSTTASATALAQQIHTANHVNSLSKNISLVLVTQEELIKD